MSLKPAPEVTDINDDPVDINDVLEYLDNMRESGVTNMFGAGPYIQKKFKVTQKGSHTLLGYWMDTFSERHAN